MRDEREIFYSVRCDGCHCLLEDYTGELARLTYARGIAENVAKRNGFVQISPRKWYCPECARTNETEERP